MWGTVLLMLVVAWLGQIYLTYRQVESYRRTVRSMARRPGGYLGIGVGRRRMGLGRGAVVVMVTDPAGVIEDCRLMHGMTVFARLRPYPRWLGQAVDQAIGAARAEPRLEPVLMAGISAMEQIMAQRDQRPLAEGGG